MVYLTTLLVAQNVEWQLYMINIGKNVERRDGGLISTTIPVFFVECLRQSSSGVTVLGRDFNSGPPKYEVGVVITQPERVVLRLYM
jgi:hypothetical protein